MIKKKHGSIAVMASMLLFSCSEAVKVAAPRIQQKVIIREFNANEIQTGTKTIAISGATIIDGNGGQPVINGCVIVQGDKIVAAGPCATVAIPAGAEITDAQGMSILPGFIDSHFHLDGMNGLPALFLQHGVTSVRDPGAWSETYDAERKSGKMIPRLFLCGPHLDMYPPAYPNDAYVVRDSLETVHAANRLLDEGATALKVYFRMPPGLIREVCKTAHSRGIPVTAHLEITEATEAIEAGLDGIEHVTSFGLSLLSKREGEKYRQLVLADNNARKEGRYEAWNMIDVNSKKADSLCQYLVQKGIFISPTLGPFEYRVENGKRDSIKLSGFSNMQKFTGKLKKAGSRIVLGSHSNIPYAPLGEAYPHEMELLAASGLSNSEIIVAATMENARFFRIDERLGSIEAGKIADLVLVKGNPVEDIQAVRAVVKVMLNGVWADSKP